MTNRLDSPTVETRAITSTSPDPGPMPPELAELLDAGATSPAEAPPALSGLADVLHQIACGCAYGSDVEGHGVDFELLADRVRGAVLAESADARHPVEAKVWAGTWGTLGATMGLALVTLLLDRLDVLPSLLGGAHPWAGPLVLVLGVVLPPVASFLRAYLAKHTRRPADSLAIPAPSSPESH